MVLQVCRVELEMLPGTQDVYNQYPFVREGITKKQRLCRERTLQAAGTAIAAKTLGTGPICIVPAQRQVNPNVAVHLRLKTASWLPKTNSPWYLGCRPPVRQEASNTWY